MFVASCCCIFLLELIDCSKAEKEVQISFEFGIGKLV
jgi:hypothetical protein